MTNAERKLLAKKAVKGISIGDAFGESFFGDTDTVLSHIHRRKIPPTTWDFTDDTIMSMAILDQLLHNGAIDQDQLANTFAANHNRDVNRGYGATARRILREISEGGDWKIISKTAFDGMGSMGNGASMRAAPIGAYYYDNISKVKDLAYSSAEITHSNIEGIAGAMAVALGCALATQQKIFDKALEPKDFIDRIAYELPDTDTKSKIKKATTIPYHYNIETVKSILGNGSKIIVQDTVPFAIWCAAYNLDNFEEALWKAVSVLGDRDTICAIVGGIIMMSSDEKTVPSTWLNSVEDFEESDFIGGRFTFTTNHK